MSQIQEEYLLDESIEQLEFIEDMLLAWNLDAVSIDTSCKNGIATMLSCVRKNLQVLSTKSDT